MEKTRKNDYTAVYIPVSLYNRIKKMIRHTRFTNVSQYVVHVLREIVAAHEETGYDEFFTEEDKKKILERLKKLGYI